MIEFFINNWQPISNTIGAIFIFLIGRKSRRIKGQEAETILSKKELENYKLEFEIKSQMLDNLKKDFDERADFLVERNEKLESNIKKLDLIIEQQEGIIQRQSKIIISQRETILQYEQKFKKVDNENT